MTEIILIEPTNPVRDGWRLILNEYPEFKVFGCYRGIKEALHIKTTSKSSIMIIGLNYKEFELNDLQSILDKNPDANILVSVNNEDETDILKIIGTGVIGIIERKIPPAQFIETLKIIKNGGSPITPKIAQVIMVYMRRVLPDESERLALIGEIQWELLTGVACGISHSKLAHSINIPINHTGMYLRAVYSTLNNILNNRQIVQDFATERILNNIKIKGTL